MSEFNSTLYKHIGQRIKTLRTEAGFSQEELSKKIGLGRASISNIEVGRHQIPLTVLYDIAKLFNTEIYDFLPTINKIESRIKKEHQFNDILNSALLEESTRLSILNMINDL